MFMSAGEIEEEEGAPLTAKKKRSSRRRTLHTFTLASKILIVVFLISGLVSALSLMLLSLLPVYVYHEVHA
jgi:cytochrome c biogenesis protein CcdA